jgi:large subunit ribosomal protein L25
MAEEFHVQVMEREELGKNASRRLRARGMIPAVVYGGGREPVGVEVDPRPVEAVLGSEKGLNSLIHLKLGDRELKRRVLLRDVQRHPVTEQLLHADFVRVEMDQVVDSAIPIELVGEPIGVKDEGGLLDFVSRSVDVRCFPGDIPTALTIDVSHLHVGQHVEASELPVPEKVELLTPPTDTICTVYGKKAEPLPEELEEAEAAAAEAEAAEEEGEAGEESSEGEGEGE